MSALAQEADQTAEAPPRHVAIIMDGNGRWAKLHHVPRATGHKRGAESVRKTVEACIETGIEYLTIYAFSSENWKRPPTEVDDLMGLFRLYLRREVKDLDKNDVRVRFIGDRQGLAEDLIDLIDETERVTAGNKRLNLIIAVNYGSHAEILSAARRAAEDVAAGRLSPGDISEDLFGGYLETAEIPDPDLVIRTSGEKRLSNFLLWQAAYAELVFVDTLWPDFDKKTLERAVRDYQSRERRYGATGD